jgi:galactose oxidase
VVHCNAQGWLVRNNPWGHCQLSDDCHPCRRHSVLAASLTRSSWYVLADSAEFASPGLNAPGRVLDGNAASVWRSTFSPTPAALPHTITVVFGGATNNVRGLVYKPSTAGAEGRIGGYEVRLSTDGEFFPGAPVANGTFADTVDQKVVTFPSAVAKAIQLKALTEAGNRGPWTTVGEIFVIGNSVLAAPKAKVGAWGPVIPFPLVPVAAALLPGGKVRPLSPF